MEVVLFLPNFVEFIDSEESREKICRDFLVLVIVISIYYLKYFRSYIPRKIYLNFMIYIFLSEILDCLTYKILPPNKKLKEGWFHLQKKQVREDIVKLIELKCKKQL
jgi:hypothetical protein